MPGRSAEEVNEEIRALWFRTGGMLNGEQRRQYQRLVMEWAAAAPEPRERPDGARRHPTNAA
ncbi:hypothetical protein GCM10010358_32670 [Streptomyces minutiscleroticus]|uniref:Uncharacterized protein n=1 Tax=Streptomyces minutiscleroticus TaxID=68238 RepID=A0A918KTK8_9ACTN|nr:hypothetical protein GCM10010358_32670 [Streptomyces minutiscleroticus]